MSKQSENREKQGFQKKSPCCGNCVNYTSDSLPKEGWDGNTYYHETNLRCGIGGFKIGKSNWCKRHKFNA